MAFLDYGFSVNHFKSNNLNKKSEIRTYFQLKAHYFENTFIILDIKY